MVSENKKLSIIAFSGDFDKLTAVFTLGTGAAAVGYEVNIFFTFWGLDAIKQKQGRSFTGGNWLTKLFGFMMGGLSVTPTSRFNFLNRLQLMHRATSLFDSRTLAIHPASTIFGLFPERQLQQMDVRQTTIRLSVGLEAPEDLLQDIQQALS